MKFVLIATAAFILAAPLAAQAGHGHGGGNGHGDGSAHANDDGDRREDSDHAHWRSQPGWTPHFGGSGDYQVADFLRFAGVDPASRGQ